MRKPWAGLSLGILLLAGCTGPGGAAAVQAAGEGAVPGVITAPIVDSAPSHAAGHGDAQVLNMVNTGSVLFPSHDMHEQAVANQMAAYLESFKDFAPKTLQVRHSDYARGGPGIFYEALTLLSTGTEVTVDGASGSWYRLADGGGYVPMTNVVDPDNPSDLVWTMHIANTGDSETINECAGGLTEFKAMTKDLGVPAYAMHSYCGGEPILTLVIGDPIAIDGKRYEVISTNDFPLFGSTELMRDLTQEDAFVQACDLTKGITRMVGLKAAN